MKTILFIVLALFTLGVYQGRTILIQNQNTPQKIDKKAEKEAARKILRGLGGGRKTIPAEVLETGGDVVKRLDVGLPVLTPNGGPFNLQTYLAGRACAADAIFIGSVKDKTSHLTDDETFVFSDYQIYVDTIIKNDQEVPLNTSTTVDVSRIGGELQIHGHLVKAISQAVRPLEVGSRYLLFVTFLPERNSFTANSLTFLLKGDEVVRVTDEVQPGVIGTGRSTDFLINEVKAAVASECKTDEVPQ
jgi:hypothetical protein